MPATAVWQFTITYQVRNNAGPTFDALFPLSEPLISLSGVSVRSTSGPVVTQVGTVDTPSFQFPPASTNVTSAPNPFSGKRSQTIRGNAGLSAGPDVFDYLASIYVVDVPAGANITIATTSPLQPGCTWTLPTLPHTSVTQAYLICVPVSPAVSAGPTLPFLIMEFPASHPNFPNGAVATINTRAYIVETGADPNWSTLFDPSVALQDPLSGITQIIDDTPNSSTSVGPFEVDDRMNARLSVLYGTTTSVPSVNSLPLVTPYTGAIAAPQDTMTITSGGNPLFYEHHVLQNLRVTAILTDPLADYTNLYAEVTVRQFDNATTTRDVPIPNSIGVNLIFSNSPTNPVPGANFALPSNSPVASYRVVIRRLTAPPPGGTVVPGGLSIGSTYGVSAGYHTSYLSVVDGDQAPAAALEHCQTWALAPLPSASQTVCATSTVIDGFPLGTTPLAGGVLAEGATTNVTIGFTNGEARRTITDATMTVVLPPGFSYTGGSLPIPTITPGGFGKSPSLSLTPLPSPTIVPLPGFPFGFTRLTFALPDLVPVTPWITYVPTGGFQSKDYQWSLPIQVASTAYNPPASDTSRITVAVTAASLTPWGLQYVYLPTSGPPPSELGLGTGPLPWTQGSFRVSVIGQIRGTSAVFDAPTSGFDDSTTVVAGNPATIRRTVLNTFIGPVSVLRLYDRIPRSGVDGSTFTATLTGPPVVVSPGAWTTLVSTSDNPCRMPVDPDPLSCTGIYVAADSLTVWPSVRSLRFDLVTPLPSNGRSEITYQIDTPAAASAGAQALSRFSMFGSTFNGAVFSEVLSSPARVLLTAAPAAAASPSPAGMALTGLQPFAPAVGAFFALLLGSVMLLIVRRSRRPR